MFSIVSSVELVGEFWEIKDFLCGGEERTGVSRVGPKDGGGDCVVGEEGVERLFCLEALPGRAHFRGESFEINLAA